LLRRSPHDKRPGRALLFRRALRVAVGLENRPSRD
jgi:hypothetical protein